jgi:glycosyltransferase involved in cell wall biosynthesis
MGKIALMNSKNVFLHGRVEHRLMLDFAAKSDIYLALYDEDKLNNRFTASNKLYEAAQLGIPLLTSKGTSLANTVLRWKLGWVIDANNPNEFLEVLKESSSMATDQEIQIKANFNLFLKAEKLSQEAAYAKLAEMLQTRLKTL